MIAGLDFGTSNCAIGLWRDQQVTLVPLEDGRPLVPSTLHAPRHNLLLPAARGTGTESPALMLNPAVWPQVRFGAAATEAYLLDPLEGFYVKSPKSFLGARGISPEIRDRFTAFVTAMMRNIFERATRWSGEPPTAVVIGRPVNFQGAGNEADNRRATAILETAARACGVRDITFLFEPMAAALEYEARQTTESCLLVVDIGGGTTDCSFIRIGPSRQAHIDRTDDILGHAGERIGGNDYDQLLAFHGMMPSFGLGALRENGLTAPNHLFMDAVTINDVNAQQRFYSASTREQLARYAEEMSGPNHCRRLLTVCNERLSWRLVAVAEQAKIRLSEDEAAPVELGFVEPGLALTLSRRQLQDAAARLVEHLHDLLREVLAQGGRAPDRVYLTGGMAKAALTRACVTAALPSVPLTDSDHFMSVTSGLTLQAARLFR